MSLASKARNEKIASNRLIILLSVLLLASVTLALLSYLHTERWFEYNSRYMAEVAKQQILAQQLAKYSLMAQQGEKAPFGALRKASNDFHNSISVLKSGVEAEGLPPSPEEVASVLGNTEQGWLSLQGLVGKILVSESALNQIHDSTLAIFNQKPKLETDAAEIVRILVSHNAPVDQVAAAATQVMLVQRIDNSLRRMLLGGTETEISVNQFRQDIKHFSDVLGTMLKGGNDAASQDNQEQKPEIKVAVVKSHSRNRGGRESRDQAPTELSLAPPLRNFTSVADAKRKLEVLADDFKPVIVEANKLIDLVPTAMPALDAIAEVSQASEKADQVLKVLLDAYRKIPGRLSVLGFAVGQMTVLIFGVLAAIFLILLGSQILTDSRRREAEAKVLNETNQKAILRLLDEMGDLADGDLTVAATVTEDITGAIADSINYAIEALRNLVTTINQTSEKISGASQESRNTTVHLLEASELQAQQITQASSAIKDMTIAIDGMARNAKESAEVARRAVEIANKGAGTVHNTIQGMNTIREQIQETSKRIKLLGDNSQEIGDIVELIDDIADQTNILALNAAMQAAMAGEAGRGFAVVADEVQRLAERSGSATKQIEALVKTIQADTHEAINSMEVSTAGVVRGARLAEDAGKALGEIEEVSNYIAGLTREIADSALHESQEASKVDEGMSVIQEITDQAAEGTRQTAAAVGTLAELADELQRSVAGFRLPH